MTNKLLGYVESDCPEQLALDIRIEVARAWKQISDEALERLRPYVNENLWDRQIKDFIEFYAVWVLLPDLNDYGTALRRAEQLLTARKTLRDFKQNEPAKMFGEKKSSLDGGRESVLLMDKQNDLARFGIKSHETLDAISAVKRLSLYTRAGSRFCPSAMWRSTTSSGGCGRMRTCAIKWKATFLGCGRLTRCSAS